MDRVRRMEELEFLMDTGERVPFRKRDHKEIKSRFSQYMFRRAREEDLLDRYCHDITVSISGFYTLRPSQVLDSQGK